MLDECNKLVAEQIISFLIEIGLEVRKGEIQQTTFLPGIAMDCGALIVDGSKLLYPGDLLHEAGHLAVIPAERRKQKRNYVGKKAAEEMMAIAWSYAALVHLSLEPSVVFHADGYRGGSQALIENFTQGRYIGVPMLQWIGLTADEKRAPQLGIKPYPNMIAWLLD